MQNRMSPRLLPAILALCCLPLAPGAGTAQTPAPLPSPAPEPIQVLILGTFHFADHSQDITGVNADNMLAPGRQAELADLASRLGQFKPTKIAVEGVSERPDFVYEPYGKFTADDLAKNRNERVQIGYRLAKLVGHEKVYGIDEQSDTVDYFPFEKVEAYAKEHGRAALLEEVNAPIAKEMQHLETLQKTLPVRLLLAGFNEPALIASMSDSWMYRLLGLGDPKQQPGAELAAAWYLRNAKIFAKLMQVAKPGDRIVIVYGQGHCYWLRHFVEHTPGFTLVEAGQYLR